MAMVSGPRQVGKTTTCRLKADVYLNWDNGDDRAVILRGPAAVIERLGLQRLGTALPTVLFDELHKFRRWKQFLKGFFDTYGEQIRILVTGSSRMDLYRRGGDSLMGRYLLYRMHPFTVAEVAWQDLPDPERIVRAPRPIPADEFSALWTHGGYPEPFVKRDLRFTRRWQALRLHQLLREDVRDMTRIQQLGQLETLATLLSARSGQQLTYSHLAAQVQTSIDTIRRWITILCHLQMGFLVRPWFRNVSRSLRKEPKWFLRDWSGLEDPGARAETFVACHLLKAVEGWTDLGLGRFDLGYVRDKEQHEVDFLVARDGKPWFLVEVKSHDDRLSPALKHFQEQLHAPLAFQVLRDADFVAADCFAAKHQPVIVPALTFLSQLL
ncbi:MAG: ATP-binding protein [Planctomycetes bacterium]|nr:ATP-binding protein [Planctomycetota bacterium]